MCLRRLPSLSHAVLPLILAVTSGVSAFGQTLDPSRRVESVPSGFAPTLNDAEDLYQRNLGDDELFAPMTPGDPDLGDQLILKSLPKERPFRAYADAFMFWTNNAGNSPANEQDDSFWGARLGAGFQPRLGKKLFADINASQQIFRYNEFEVLDFESLDLSAGLIYVEPRLADTLFFAQYNFNRITGDDFGDELLNSHSIRAGVQKAFILNRRSSIHVSLMGDWDIDTDLEQLDRHEYLTDVSWRFKIMRDLVLALNYRYTWLDYNEVDRGDSLHVAGASLTWSPKSWLDVYLSANFSLNESDIDVFDYESANLGGGLGVKVRF